MVQAVTLDRLDEELAVELPHLLVNGRTHSSESDGGSAEAFLTEAAKEDLRSERWEEGVDDDTVEGCTGVVSGDGDVVGVGDVVWSLGDETE